MDWTSIVVAVLALVGTFAGSALGIRQSNKIVELRLNTLDEKVDNVEDKVDKFNNLCERVAVVENSLKAAHHRLDGLEGALPRVAKK